MKDEVVIYKEITKFMKYIQIRSWVKWPNGRYTQSYYLCLNGTAKNGRVLKDLVLAGQAALKIGEYNKINKRITKKEAMIAMRGKLFDVLTKRMKFPNYKGNFKIQKLEIEKKWMLTHKGNKRRLI